MPKINYGELLDIYTRNPAKCRYFLREAVQSGYIRTNDFSVREAALHLVTDRHGHPAGHEFVAGMGPGGGLDLMEAGESVKTAAFSNISGQLLITRLMNAFAGPEFVWPRLVETVPTMLSGEKIPNIGDQSDDNEVVGEGKPYPEVGLVEDWITTPETVKKGKIMSITRESIFFDRTGVLMQRADQIGRTLGINQEKEVIDEVLGVTNSHKRKDVAIDTYGNDSGTHSWDNLAASNALVTWVDVNDALLLLAAMLDPNSGEPIMVLPTTIITSQSLAATAKQILNATFVRTSANADANTLTQNLQGPTPIDTNYDHVTSAYIDARITAGSLNLTDWFIGAPRSAFWYMENWGIEVERQGAEGQLNFERDVVARVKVSKRGVVTTAEPRHMVKSTA